ncbi:MAG: precorrin-4 C(11)-methyltransferase [Bacteroidales bacterium]|nr:precorrin-4 C(11)-methyltransferase [Bacteroidales bacterium]
MKTAIIQISSSQQAVVDTLLAELPNSIVMKDAPVPQLMKECFAQHYNIVFIGALGICVRALNGLMTDKYHDPAVVCMDTTCQFVIPVLSGHVGGANDLAHSIARIFGIKAVVTTQSDCSSLWALDTLAARNGWQMELVNAPSLNHCIAHYVNKEETALLIEHNSKEADDLRNTKASHVSLVDNICNVTTQQLLLAVTHKEYKALSIPAIYYRPAVLHLGFGCKHQCNPEGIVEQICNCIREKGFSPLSVASISTHEIKKDEPLFRALQNKFPWARKNIFTTEELKDIVVPNPSEKAFQVTGLYGVAESCAILASGNSHLLIEKQKGCVEGTTNNYTFALALDESQTNHGHIEIVGAGPGDPELISVRGKRMLQKADLVLYAGSLVPVELTQYAPDGCVVRSSAGMDLEEQFALMKQFYDKGKFVVRLHTGDPCIYGAIQEQMAYFDQYGMDYHITPGISSFQAAAAELKSQFTIPEKVQSIILTRGEGRTPMPEKEQLHKLAQSQSTMCIYLSAGIVEDVQRELLMSYPPETPVAACYKLTWKEQRIYRGQLKDLAKIVRENNLTLTTLLVVSEAIDNRKGLSRLYSSHFTHLYRESKD